MLRELFQGVQSRETLRLKARNLQQMLGESVERRGTGIEKEVTWAAYAIQEHEGRR